MRVLLADDHALIRAGLRALLQAIPGVEIVGEAGDGREALRLIEQAAPDVVLMDITMPGLNGLEAAERVIRDHPKVRLVILSMHEADAYVAQALRIGVAGYLVKDAAPNELVEALRTVAEGQTYLSPAISRQVVEAFRSGTPDSPLQGLTPRQREILQLVAEGHSTKEIANLLHLSVKTVETHRAQLMERLGIHDVPGLVKLAIRLGLTSAEP
jgi:DNA-binding NarL/FixJ family response regulator